MITVLGGDHRSQFLTVFVGLYFHTHRYRLRRPENGRLLVTGCQAANREGRRSQTLGFEKDGNETGIQSRRSLLENGGSPGLIRCGCKGYYPRSEQQKVDNQEKGQYGRIVEQ
ncbi:hypothetical protein chiPu_0010318 [Chiloscyllium punctatum]|uniref:Uncharacterized protein n=1 Tax=Chiloscyllium punctatum TaxID=137246 RepID=A0A401SNA0_CHIPU|nr:hypothetical protein [Chiloscyllium punctatum]